MVDINPGLTIWTFIIFIVLLIILSKVGWKPLLASLKAREQAIADSLQRAEQARADAERMIAANQRERARAEEETRAAIEEGRAFAERMRADLMAKAEEESKRLLAQSRAQIARDTTSAIEQLRSAAADLAITATGKLIDAELNDDRHRALVKTMIADLPANVN